MTTREGMERAAEIAETPYSDAVCAFGPDEPMAVGKKIAAAIRAEAERLPAERDAVLDAYVAELERRALEQKEWESHPKCEDNGVGDTMLVIVNELRAIKSNADPQHSTAEAVTAPSQEGVGQGEVAGSAPERREVARRLRDCAALLGKEYAPGMYAAAHEAAALLDPEGK